MYRQTSNISNTFVDHSVVAGASVMLQLHLRSRLNTWLQWIAQRQLQDETINILISGFGATYNRYFTVITHPYQTSRAAVWMSNSIPLFYVHVIIYACPNSHAGLPNVSQYTRRPKRLNNILAFSVAVSKTFRFTYDHPHALIICKNYYVVVNMSLRNWNSRPCVLGWNLDLQSMFHMRCIIWTSIQIISKTSLFQYKNTMIGNDGSSFDDWINWIRT